MIIFSMHILPRMNVLLDFICMGSADLHLYEQSVESEKIRRATVGLGIVTVAFSV